MQVWAVLFDDAFAAEFGSFERGVQLAIATYAEALARTGPSLGRPFADTLKGSSYRNMKELRPTVNKVEWRIAFAFDPERNAILLAAAAKGGSKTAYRRLIKTADDRFAAHLTRMRKE